MLLGFKNTANNNVARDKRLYCAVLTNEQMAEADRLTGEAQGETYSLMLSAGQAVANVVHQHYKNHDIFVLAGPGNNGGDGFVAAMFLQGLGHKVDVMGLVPARKYKGDAKQALQEWGGKLLSFKKRPDIETREDSNKIVVIDAIFGTGFRGVLEKPVTDVLDFVRSHEWPVVAVDVPSGVNGNTGGVDPATVFARHTVTFFKKKLAHVLMPALELCGDITVHDIGINETVLRETDYAGHENMPWFWHEDFPRFTKGSHKYDRGHAVMLGGDRMTGAVRLSSEAAMRMGAGLVTIACLEKAQDVYQKGAAHIMVEPLSGGYSDMVNHAKDDKRNALLIGPGAGLEDSDGLKEAVLSCMALGKPIVLDADALSCFADEPSVLLDAMHDKCVITPHEGEFARLFPNVEGLKHERAMLAADMTQAVVLFKGADTVIAQTGRKPVFHTHATQWLATAGAGDVLAGMICGLLAQGMPSFEAACAGAWIHGDASVKKGAGLVAPDIIEEIPSILRNFS